MSNTENAPRIISLKETTSTNSYLRDLLTKEALPEGSVVVTEAQTSGRGQIGNVWESEPGKNLTFSMVIYPDCIPANRQFLISQIAALSVKETLDAYTGNITVKWPNDVYWNDKKICGMLIENDLSGDNMYCSVIGIGLNVNQELFRGDAPNPVSLWQIIGKETDKTTLLNRFMRIFFNYYLALLQDKQSEIGHAYRKTLYRGEGFFAYADEHGPFEACIHDIELTGHLVLRLRNGHLKRYAFKEVSCL